jgi:hypothetical protein
MASIYDLLAGNVQSEQDYLAQDPYYASGRGILGIQAQPTNSTEAWIGPLLQGLAGGGLMGLGKQNAAQSAFSDARSSPFLAPLLAGEKEASMLPDYTANSYLAPYLQDEMPEGFTPKQAKADQIMALLLASNNQEAEIEKIKQAADMKKALLPYSQLAVDVDAAKKANDVGADNNKSSVQLNKGLNFIEEGFEKAKKFAGTPGAAVTSLTGIGTTSGEALASLGDSMLFQADMAIGREINSDARNRLLQLAPKWNDTDATLDRKKADMKEFVISLSKGNPAEFQTKLGDVAESVRPPPPLPGETKEAYKARLKGS